MIEFLASDLTSIAAPSAEFRQALARVFEQKNVGFFELPFRKDLWLAANQVGQKLRARFSRMVIVGMGGSSLGPKALYQAIGHEGAKQRLLFLDNLDSTSLERFFKRQDLSDCVFVYMSKSGSTLETLGLANMVIAEMKNHGLAWQEHTVVVSELKSNPLSNWARENNLDLLEIPENVGGRFSVLSAVGLLPACFMGYSLVEMEEGAKLAIEDKEKIATLAQLSVQSFKREEWISFFWFYTSYMKEFGYWWQQLWAESLAKKQTRSGKPAQRVSTPFVATGACDQHSLLQQVMDGHRDKWVVFIRTKSAECDEPKILENLFPVHHYLKGTSLGQVLAAQAQSTQIALAQNGVNTLTLHIPELSAKTMAYLFLFFELVVATIAESLDLNAYDQPGVEHGKKIAAELLSKSK